MARKTYPYGEGIIENIFSLVNEILVDFEIVITSFV